MRQTEPLTHAEIRLLQRYTKPNIRSSLWQLITSVGGFALCWYAAVRATEYSWALAILPAAACCVLLMRTFIVQHDCGHGSFFRSRRTNEIAGWLLGVVTLTPYCYWQRTHALHHASSSNLDERGLGGDIITLTVREYLARDRAGRLRYRLYRGWFVLLVIGPAYQFFLKHRIPFDPAPTWRREWLNVIWTDLAVIALAALVSSQVGFGTFLAIQIPIAWVTFAVGIWLFYVQHQFEGAYWARDEQWTFEAAGIEGASFLDLPAVLHWCTGNIGFHHVHHLAPRIPNYRLKRCFEENREALPAQRVTLRDGIAALRLKLWDEDRGRLVSIADAEDGEESRALRDQPPDAHLA